MEFYGNIATLYNATAAQIDQVKTRLTDLGYPFGLVESTFFFGTSSVKKSKDFEKELSTLSIEYTFFFLFNADGSYIKGNIDSDTLAHIDNIFFEDV